MNEDGDDKYWWKLSYLTSKWSKNENPEKSRNFFLNPGIKNIGKSRPEKSRDPGIWQNPVPKNPGIEILDPVRAWSIVVYNFSENADVPKLNKSILILI